MNILITGANGQLGNEMRVLSKENGQHAYFFLSLIHICIATSLGHAPQAALADPAAGSVLSVSEALTNLV